MSDPTLHVPTSINVNDVKALLEELRHLVLNHGATGPQSPNLRQRLRVYSRISWLAARMAWLETDDLITSSGVAAEDDPESTGDIPTLRCHICGQQHNPIEHAGGGAPGAPVRVTFGVGGY